MEPAAEHDFGREPSRQAGEVGKNGLGDIFSQVGVVIQQPEGGGIDQINVGLDQLPEGLLGASLDVIGE